MLDFCIIGSGISGSTIAHYLQKKYSLKVFDKAKGVGGRSSFKRYKGKIGFDHGLNTYLLDQRSLNLLPIN